MFVNRLSQNLRFSPALQGPALLVLLIALTKFFALFFLIALLGGDLGAPFNLVTAMHPFLSAALGIGMALLSVLGWIALWHFSHKKNNYTRTPLEQINKIGN